MARELDDDAWFPLEELTGRLGGLVWVEDSVATVLDRWASIDSHAGAAVVFATSAAHHRWHAEVVRSCLATSPRLGADRAERPPTAGWQDAIETLTAVVEPARTSTRLKVLQRIVDPWLRREIGTLVELSRPVSDAALLRWLDFCSLDHDRDGAAVASLGEALQSDAVRFDDHRLLHQLDLS